MLQYLHDYRGQLLDGWATGAFTYPGLEATAMKTVETVARCNEMQRLAELSFDDLAGFYGAENEEME